MFNFLFKPAFVFNIDNVIADLKLIQQDLENQPVVCCSQKRLLNSLITYMTDDGSKPEMPHIIELVKYIFHFRDKKLFTEIKQFLEKNKIEKSELGKRLKDDIKLARKELAEQQFLMRGAFYVATAGLSYAAFKSKSSTLMVTTIVLFGFEALFNVSKELLTLFDPSSPAGICEIPPKLLPTINASRTLASIQTKYQVTMPKSNTTLCFLVPEPGSNQRWRFFNKPLREDDYLETIARLKADESTSDSSGLS